jgi:hypothetical protein
MEERLDIEPWLVRNLKIPIRCLYDNDKRMKAISLTHAISQNEWKKVRKRV